MENLSHSRQPNRASPALPKKACNGNGYDPVKATTYDGVFGGPPRLGAPTLSPCLEDYGEIFGRFHTSRASSSIPVLDLPLVDEDEVFFDVQSSGFDYGDVFGGFDSLDFAASYEELLMDQLNGGDVDSSDEAWTPAETESLSEGSDHSGKSQCLLNGDSYESIDGSTEFSISYNKASQRSDVDMSNGMTHIAELHAVPGYTFAVDETTPFPKEFENPSVQVTNDSSLSMDYTWGIMKGKHLKKTLSHPANGSTGGQIFENDVKPQRKYSRNGSCPNEVFVSVSEISLRTHPSELPPPSRPPPVLDVKKGDSSRSTSNCRITASEGSVGDSSPPFFDVEIDASSAAAASAAAMKEAMDKARAQLKSAKELMERKRDGVQSHVKPGSMNGRKDKEGKLSKIIDGSCSIELERVQGTCERGDNGMKLSVLKENQKLMKGTQAVPGSLEAEKTFNIARKSSEEKHKKKSWSCQGPDKVDGDDEWEEAAQFFELVRSDKSKTNFEKTNTEEILGHNTKFHEHRQKEKKAAMEVLGKQQEKKVKALGENHKAEKLEKNSDIAGEACGRKENNRRSEAAIEAHRHKRHEKKVKVAQEVREEIEKKFGMAAQLVETEKTPTNTDRSEKHRNLVKVQREDNKVAAEQAMKHKENALQQKEANKSTENQKQVKESHGREVNEKSQKEVFEWEENEKKLREALEQAEYDKRLREALEQEQKEKRLKDFLERREDEKKEKEAREREENEKRHRAQEQIENERRLKETIEQIENGKRLKETNEQIENERRLKEAHVLIENEKRLTEALEREENERRLKEAHEQIENEKRLKEALEHEEKERRLKEVLEQAENEWRLKEVLEQAEIERRLKEALEQEEMEKRQREAREREENEQRFKEALEQKENEKKQTQACERGEIEKRLKEACEKEKIEKRLKGFHAKEILEEEREQDDNSKTLKVAQEREETELRFKETIEQEENRNTSKEACTWEETEKKLKGADEGEGLKGLNKAQQFTERDENGKKLKMKEGIHLHIEEGYLRVSDEACILDVSEKIQVTGLTGKHEENSEKLEKTQEAFVPEENGKMQTELKHAKKKSEAVEMRNALVDGKTVVSGMPQGDLELEENLSRKVDVTELLQQEDRVKKAGGAGIGIGQRNVEKANGDSQIGCDMGNQQREFIHTWEERGKNIKQPQASLNQEESKSKFMSTQVLRESVETGRKLEAAQSSILKGKGSTQKTAQPVDASQSTGRKDRNLNETPASDEKEAERIRREKEFEKERIRKIDEEREREREREKDRMAVDRLNTEARDRAERVAVERATAEARHRALVEARERLEKACAEAREKTMADNTSNEARLRAERAAVERATAEAREKTMADNASNEARLRAERAAVERATAEARERAAEKASFEARERVERYVSDKFSASSRNSGMSPSSSSSDIQDQQFQSTASFGASRYQHSSAYSASYYSERSEGFEGESAQRCKARLERHQRTAERAAKALAEKNMRDLLAQREQAERNRLAETLDADVKRWSSGKEGNLRALLSTLQYILGPDGGWQPIPLTEVITSAAVKKAYRKATLCVHPDKLQQRGASIQQKYVCEKVFDLLKEAWNTFNSEER